MVPIYGEVSKILPTDASKPLGKTLKLAHYADANLFHDALSKRSVTSILRMINATPIDWYFKKQAIVEAVTYGSKFVATCIYVEHVIDLCNTLRYLGIPVKDRSYVFGNNEPVQIFLPYLKQNFTKGKQFYLSTMCTRLLLPSTLNSIFP